jgi:hypothetical protein
MNMSPVLGRRTGVERDHLTPVARVDDAAEARASNGAVMPDMPDMRRGAAS